MLIKPINDIRNPRHILDDDTDDTTPHPIPTVSIDLQTSSIGNIVVIPKTISILQDELSSLTQVGTVKIEYPELVQTTSEESQLDYDEDEQLYSAIRQRELDTKYPTAQIPIYSISNGNVVLTVPHFYNTIAYNVLARQLVKVGNPKQWILLSPCSMNNNQTIAILESNPLLEVIPVLTPPHTVTGISAAIISQLPPSAKLIPLVLNSEGQPGFEKSDNDAIIDICVILGEVLQIEDKEDYLKRVSSKVRKFNGYSNLGMYI
ncbi:uncharacterized protein SPAPADRAFT_59115 [Spathaspora passalidarum NRRL Y-27907]|uniref:Proteasome assembly chaperone 1 n=1 Tax=Spathaspora passalidarum (strain NRRL Y-27907 / 11-Y1) TaxID=619300 RepID=G3AIU0_SPAPN|nr:uncharacterized protein SPAPADRAFT_59115 [Spathaspora passalidarum NRRL Y-27907]EGW33751.1 hypothetical protein SPAPADRAFT_59115 [Spathaspora passalidarum NRRL Y-27907]